MNAYQYVTKENLLDWVESHGRNMLMLTVPSAHPYDDERRAKPYEEKQLKRN